MPFKPSFRKPPSRPMATNYGRFGARSANAPNIGLGGEVIRVRPPRQDEILGTVLELHGGSRMTVACQDGNTRMCRIPGKIRKKLWIKAGDIVAIIPWQVEANEKGDISYRYTSAQASQLRQKGFIK